MQIFTTGMLIQMYVQSRELAGAFFGEILSAIWHNITDLSALMFTSFTAGDWRDMIAAGFMLFCAILVLYRLIRRNLWMTIKSVLGN